MLISLSCAGHGVKETSVQEKPDLKESEQQQSAYRNYDAYYHFALSRMNTYKRDLEGAISEMQYAVGKDPDSAYLKYNLALLYLASGENERAIQQLREAIDTDPDYVPPYKVLGKLYATSEREDYRGRAEEILRKCVELDPEDYESNLLLGVYYIDNNNYEEAKKYLRRSIDIKPSDIKSYFYLGEVLSDQGKLNEAEKIYGEILEIDPDNYSTLVTLAVIYENLGNNGKAESYYRKLLKYYPDNPLVYQEYGSFLYRNGRSADAVLQFENAEVLDSSDTGIKLKLGILYLENGEYTEAMNKYNYVLQDEPENDTARYYKGIALSRVGNVREAGIMFGSIGEESDYYTNSIIQLALIREKEGEIGKAAELLESRLEKYPDNQDLVNYLGQIYRKKNNFSRAILLYEDYLEKYPESEQIIYSLAVTHFYNGSENLSISVMKSLLDINPDHADALNFIGYTYADMGANLDEAEMMIRKALELSPDSGYIVDSLGWLYYQRGQYDKAMELIERASGMTPDDAVIKEHLGDVYLQKNNKIDALKSYRRALELLESGDMEPTERDELKKRLEEKIRQVYKLI